VRERHYHVYSLACRQVELTPLDAHDYWRKRRLGASTFDLVAPLDANRLDAFRRLWLDSIEQPGVLLKDRLVPGATSTLRQLSEAGYRLALVTLRRSRTALIAQVQSLGLWPLFTLVLSPGEADGSDKPTLITRAGYGRDDIIIGDSESDVAAARSLDITCICVTTGVRSPGYLRSLAPARVISSLRALPSALGEDRPNP